MLTVSKRCLDRAPATERLVLPYESRCKSRLRAQLESGEEAGLVLERGQVLRHGDRLLADDGRVIEVVAADETISSVTSDDPRQLARAAYHLGNRHIALQIEATRLSYQHDHVLDDMVQGLGLPVTVLQAPFQPEPGAYSSHGHLNGHPHDHPHTHPHNLAHTSPPTGGRVDLSLAIGRHRHDHE